MQDLELLEIARFWSFWEKPPAKSIPRELTLPKSLSNRTALIIHGVRRCGKSTLLSQLIEYFELQRENCLFVNFEDPRLAGSLEFETLERLLTLFRKNHRAAATLTFFFDEIQWVSGWEKWLRTKLERPGRNQFILSGSNAHLLSGELSSVLTGRHITAELFPFNYPEFLKIKKKGSVVDFLSEGGFPEPLLSGHSDALLRQYFSDILQRDVRERVAARSSMALRQIVQMTFESAGAELSLRRIAAASGVAVETAAAYLDACEQAYLLFSCPFFAYSERKRQHRNRKFYPVDTGLRRVAVTKLGEDLGKSLECATFIELRKRFGEVFYWREKGEVDFVVLVEGKPIPIQVTLDRPQDRHHLALESFYETFPNAGEAVTITLSTFPDSLNQLPT